MRLAAIAVVCFIGCTPAVVAAPVEPASTQLALPSVSAAASNAPSSPPPPEDDAEAAMNAALDKRVSDPNACRAALVELIRRWPASPSIPLAWATIGDLAFDAAGADPAQLVIAQRAYEGALLQPPPGNKTYAYASYRLGWVFVDLSDFARALSSFMKVVEITTQYPDGGSAAALRRETLRDIVLPYARVGEPTRAFPFFRHVASSDAEAWDVMGRLGEQYRIIGKFPAARAIYTDLATRDPAHACAHGVRAQFSVVGANAQAEENALRACP